MDGREGIRILLADEHSLFLESLKVVLEREPDLRVVAEAENGSEAVEQARSARPHVAAASASLPVAGAAAIEPAGSAPVGDGGQLVGPYTTAAKNLTISVA